jgi:hypothetical protein
MLTNESAGNEVTPSVSPGNYSPVTVTVSDSIGAMFLGILAVILLIGWRRSETRYRRLIAEREMKGSSQYGDSTHSR